MPSVFLLGPSKEAKNVMDFGNFLTLIFLMTKKIYPKLNNGWFSKLPKECLEFNLLNVLFRRFSIHQRHIISHSPNRSPCIYTHLEKEKLTNFVLFWDIWRNLNPMRAIWTYLGAIWSCLKLIETSLSYLKPFKAIWSYLELFWYI